MKKLVFVLVILVLAAFPVAVFANTRTTGGGGDLPFYARIERGEILHTDDWAAIIFYRPPGCVLKDFNLLDMINYEAFGCTPPTTDGFIIWEGEPLDSAPIQIKLHGLGTVPVWFVSWPELEEAVADDNLTIDELFKLSSLLVGTADFYTETLHPAGVVKVPMIEFVARGSLENNDQSFKSFRVHALLVVDRVTNVQITIK